MLVQFNLDLVARKPVFRGLRTTQAQTSLRIRAVWSAPLLLALWKVSYINLIQVKFQFSSQSVYLRRLFWNSLFRKLRRQVFSRRGPFIKYNCFKVNIIINYLCVCSPLAHSWRAIMIIDFILFFSIGDRAFTRFTRQTHNVETASRRIDVDTPLVSTGIVWLPDSGFLFC